jgi:phosphohistidine phosphatase
MSKKIEKGLELYLVRHAKSDWSIPGQRDFDRVLNARGKRNAPMMAEVLFKRVGEIDLIVSSPAVRAIKTASFFAEQFGIRQENVKLSEDIYEASVVELLQLVCKIPSKHKRVALFGHNPGLSHFVNYLTNDSVEMPTCAIAGIQFEIDQWGAVARGLGSLIYFDYPRKYEPREE